MELPAPAYRDGKDAFHCVPDFGLNEWDAVARVLTKFRAQSAPLCRRIFSSLLHDNNLIDNHPKTR
jgi:hypothetical protein